MNSRRTAKQLEEVAWLMKKEFDELKLPALRFKLDHRAVMDPVELRAYPDQVNCAFVIYFEARTLGLVNDVKRNLEENNKNRL